MHSSILGLQVVAVRGVAVGVKAQMEGSRGVVTEVEVGVKLGIQMVREL